jgi:hypothetical protein
LLAISVKSEITDVGKQCKTTANPNASGAVMSHSEDAGGIYQGSHVLRARKASIGDVPYHVYGSSELLVEQHEQANGLPQVIAGYDPDTLQATLV